MDTSIYSIREVIEYTDENFKAVSNLVAQLDSHAQPLTEQDLRLLLENNATHLYFTYENETNKIVGMITFIVYRIPYKMKGWIEDVVVDSTYRKKGIGEALVNFVIDEAKKYGVVSLNLTSNPKRESANKLYIRLGFELRVTNVYRLILDK